MPLSRLRTGALATRLVSFLSSRPVDCVTWERVYGVLPAAQSVATLWDANFCPGLPRCCWLAVDDIKRHALSCSKLFTVVFHRGQALL